MKVRGKGKEEEEPNERVRKTSRTRSSDFCVLRDFTSSAGDMNLLSSCCESEDRYEYVVIVVITVF